MKTIFFGDSITEGSNCESTFTDYLPPEWDVYNFGVGGTTIGEYSIYPVDGNSLLSQIKNHTDIIKDATHIFIEYGSNDVSAIMCGFATMQTVIVSLVKAIDWITQLNPTAKIIYLVPGFSAKIINSKAKCMCDYLENDYFSKFDFKFPETVYAQTLEKLICNVQNICDTMYMFDDAMIDREYLSDDNIHPNEKGHLRIAGNIVRQYI